MPLPPYYFAVYAQQLRLLDPGLHANPLIQSPPMLHFEGLHTLQWLMSDPQKLTRSVQGDGQRFALRDHDSGKWIPHLPWPPTAGPFLLETHLNSKYQVIFHQPNVEMEGSPVGIFQWLIAPPWRCSEIPLPVPKFVARRSRAAALGQSNRGLRALGKAAEEATGVLDRLEKANELKDAVDGLDVQERLREAEERIRRARADEASARAQKIERDRWVRRGLLAAEQQDRAARGQVERASSSAGSQRTDALAAAARHRAEAQTARSGAAAWAEQAQKHERDAAAYGKALEAARQERRQQIQRAEQRARDPREHARRAGKKFPPANPLARATGAGNASVACPSLLAHVPWPGTVQFHVSWTQLGKLWLGAAANLARELLSNYVGFIFDGVLAVPRASAKPGAVLPKVAAWLLDLAKSAFCDGLLGGAQKFVLESQLSIKVSSRLGPVKVGLEFAKDPKSGNWSWKASAEGNGKLGVAPKAQAQGPLGSEAEKASFKLGEQSAYEWQAGAPPVVYGLDLPAVN